MSKNDWDLLIVGAEVFETSETPRPPKRRDVAIQDGRIVDIGESLDGTAKQTVDAKGKWLLPGLLDIHTHVDLEVEIDPGLSECLRHGTTSVVMGNCSLGVAFGNQRHLGADPIVDCFARVENVPKPVLSKVAERADWKTPSAYYAHLDSLALGANVCAFLPHSMLRIEAMGLEAAISREPSESELSHMVEIVRDAMDEGYLGMSTDALPFHYLANDPNRRVRIPTQHATRRELRALLDVVREVDGVWQATPPKDKPKDILSTFMFTSGRLYGKPLKTTAVAALDVVTAPMLIRLGKVLTSVLNGPLRGRFMLQSLAAQFKTFADGPITPLAEEIEELRLLNEPDLDRREARMALLRDPDYRARFRAMWYRGKRGISGARIKTVLGADDMQLSRKLEDMTIERSPVSTWEGETMETVFKRLTVWQADHDALRLSEEETTAFAAFPAPCDDCAFFLHLLEAYDTDLTWSTVTANADDRTVKRLLMDERFLPGFADSGAHLTNMAFYDANLRALQIAAEDGMPAVAKMVDRLTRVPAEFFGVDAGRLNVGATADLVLIDPSALRTFDRHGSVRRVYRKELEHEQLVNRTDGIVTMTIVGGGIVFEREGPSVELGKKRFGRVLRSKAANRRHDMDALAAE